MRVVLVSDAHLGGPADPNQARFLDFLRTLRCDRLCLLGDVFQHWWHFGAEPFAQYRPVVEALSRFDVVFTPGNHDFHAARYFPSPGDQNWDGLRVHLSHGDEVDGSLGYRAATAVLRGRPFAALVDAMGPDRAWHFLGRLAHPPAGSPDPALVAGQHALAERRIAAGYDLVVMGHTHAPCLERKGRGWFANLGDWVSHHTFLAVEDGVPVLATAPPA